MTTSVTLNIGSPRMLDGRGNPIEFNMFLKTLLKNTTEAGFSSNDYKELSTLCNVSTISGCLL